MVAFLRQPQPSCPSSGHKRGQDPKGGGSAFSSQAWQFQGEREAVISLLTPPGPGRIRH